MRARGLTIALASLALAVGWASPAAAQSQSLWTEAQNLSAEQNDGEVPQVAIAEDGSALAVWLFNDPATNKKRVQFAARERGQNFVVPEPRQPGETEAEHIARVEPTYLSDPATEARPHIRIAMNDAGDAIVVWEAADGSVRSAYKPAGGDFGDEQVVQAIVSAEPEVGIDGQGNATVITRGTGARSGSIYRSHTRSSGAAATWGDNRELIAHPFGFGSEASPLSYVEVHGELAVDEAGNRTAVFASDADPDEDPANPSGNPTRERIFVVVRDAGATDWSVNHKRNDGTTTGHHSTRALRAGNFKLGLWTHAFDIRASTSPGNPDPFDDRLNDNPLNAPTTTSGSDFVYDSSNDPPGFALWSTGSLLHASYAQRVAAGPDPDPDADPIAGNAGATRTHPRLATDGNGSILALFKERRGNDESIQVALRPPGGATTFDGPLTVRGPGGAERSGAPVALSEPCDVTGAVNCDLEPEAGKEDPGPSLAMNSGGEAVAAWAQGDGAGNLVVKVSLYIPRPPAGSTAIDIPPPPPPRPKPAVPSLIELARPLRRGEATVLTLKSGDPGGATTSTSDGATKLDWGFGTGDEPPVTGEMANGQLERSVRLRLPDRSFKATVQAKTPDGVRTFTRTFTAPSLPETGDAGKVVDALRKVKTPPVFAVGATDTLTAQSKSCAPMKVWSGEQKIAGCFKPIEGLPDIPGLEGGAVHELAKELSLNGADKELMQKATQLSDGYVAEGRALLNDKFPVIPSNAADVVSLPQAKSLISAKAELPIGGASYDPKNGFNLKLDPKKAKVPLGKLPKPPKLPKLGGLEIVGDWDVDLEKQEAKIRASVVLPKAISKAGLRIENEVVLRATPERVIVDEVRIGPIDADVGALKVQQLKLHYKREPDEWLGEGKACIISGACFDMVPPNGRVVVKNGDLAFAGASLHFPLPGIPLFKGVFLERIGFGIGLNPTRMVGSARIGVVHIIALDGRLFLAFPSERTPFVLNRDEVGSDFAGHLYGSSFTRPTVGVSGGMLIKIPELGDIKLASGYVLYEYPGYIAFGGGYDIDLIKIVQLRGGMSGEVDLDRERFNLHGSIQACLIDEACGSAVGNISRGPNKAGGAGACISIRIAGESISVGGGVQWRDLSDPFIWPFDGCKWSKFKIDVRGAEARGAQSGGQYFLDVKSGEPSPALKLYGQGGAPLVRVSGPGGQVLESTASKELDSSPGGKIRILRFPGNQSAGPFTVVGLQDAQPGRYTVEAMPGSAAITRTARATDPPDAKVSGKVTGKGRRRVLRYDVLDREDQRVTFQEVQPGGNARTIGVTTRGGRGRIRFNSAPGRGRRQVVAQFELSGVAAERKVVATFKPASLRLAKPKRLRVRRRGGNLLARWRKVAGARSYEVAASTAGRRQVFETTRRRRAILGVPRHLSGRVTVRAVDDVRQSNRASRRFKGRGSAPSPFRPLLRCATGKRYITCVPARPTCKGRTATIVGRAGRTIRGTGRADVIVGTAGDDRIEGGGGNDIICAGPGDDRVLGGSGNDRLVGEAGRDRISGGPGRDHIDARGGTRDRVDCGRGRDRGGADRIDRRRRCERLRAAARR